MRQILCNGSKILLARMPRPTVQPGCVLVRVHYSLISAGTEIAGLRASLSPENKISRIEQIKSMDYRTLSRAVLGKAVSTSKTAITSIVKAAKSTIPRRSVNEFTPLHLKDLQWNVHNAKKWEKRDGSWYLETDDSAAHYQVSSQPLDVPEGLIPIIELKASVRDGRISLGLLNETQDAWLASRTIDEESFDERLIFNTGGSRKVTLVFANAGTRKPTQLTIQSLNITFSEPTIDGLPLSEMEDQGWNLGYSAAGEIVAVGDGITDLKPGDFVSCAGAGLANHADYVCVPRNLACPVPKSVSLQVAAFTTVGSIALQGVRRASPLLGEKICVIGLGLLGQITVQMLRANGCEVFGHDLAQDRVGRALKAGMEAGDVNSDSFATLVRDRTHGMGADCTIITASAKTSAVINFSMKITRRKGRVVIVGDIGLELERPQFYQKEIDLLMSTSYGPGRYDPVYEIEGRDYPFAYVRWTLNRNMQAFLDMCASRRLDIESLIDTVADVDKAPQIYQTLAEGKENLPVGVLLRYRNDNQSIPIKEDVTRISLRGTRKILKDRLNYALVGAGAFGTCMLVPMMAKRPDRFFLRGVVSRDTTRGGNFARANQVELFTTDYDEVLKHPEIDLIVISSRHHEHAAQTIAALKAGKNVFTEKPLALNWEELNSLVTTCQELDEIPYLMVGFNRRFSPALQKLRERLTGRRSPLIINYRLNGGYIPLDSWIQDRRGGGRNIGEACHIYDVFRSLSGAPVESIQATAIDPGDLPYLRNDNFTAALRYEDGSVGNLVYAALGPKTGLPKERIEVFCDGEAYIVDDYKILIQAGTGDVLWQSTDVDKGHFEELSRFGDAVATGGEPPIPFDEIIETSAVALHIEDLLFQRETETASSEPVA